MALDKIKHGDITVLTPKKDLMGGDETEELEKEAREIAGQGHPKIVIDLGKVSYVNSTGLGSLASIHVTCQKAEGWMRLARTTRRIKNLFLITKLNMVFDSYDSVEDAKAELEK